MYEKDNEERELLEKFRAEMDAAAECKRDGRPTHASDQMLEMAEDIVADKEIDFTQGREAPPNWRQKRGNQVLRYPNRTKKLKDHLTATTPEEIKEKEWELFRKIDEEIEISKEARRNGQPMPNREKLEALCHELSMLPDQEIEEYDFTDVEILEAEDTIKFFEAKYGGSYESTLKLKEKKTHNEEHDDYDWRYMLQRIKNREE